MLHGRLIVERHVRTLQSQGLTRRRNWDWDWRTRHRHHLVTLAIETSCDDTAVAVLEKKSHLDQLGHDSDHNHSPGDGTNSSSTKLATKLATLHFNERVTAQNTGLGGIHPVEALNSHRSNLAKLVKKAVNALPLAGHAVAAVANVTGANTPTNASQHVVMSNTGIRQKPDFISVTRGPGMRSNLGCGLDLAKGLSVAWQIPLLGVHHMQAHALTPRLETALKTTRDGELPVSTPSFPFLTLLVSGGHTMLLHSTGLVKHRILASTADVAIGDALDKAGRAILPEAIKSSCTDTAFGKYLSSYAFSNAAEFDQYRVPETRGAEVERPCNEYGWQVQVPFRNTKQMTYSFASIPTTVERILQTRPEMNEAERKLLAQSVLGTAFEHLGSRTIIALQHFKEQGVEIGSLVISGGVAANDFLRYYLRAMLDIRGFGAVELLFPRIGFCTDNAAMIAWCGMEMFEAGYQSNLDIHPIRKWSMDDNGCGEGILGVDGWTRTTSK